MKLAKKIICIGLIAFALHFIWENAQAPLYQGYTHFLDHLSICSVATGGDVLIVLFVFGGFALFYRNAYWLSDMNAMHIIILAIIGALIAVAIEAFALHSGRWIYADTMPTVGNIGIFPILQMTIILPLTFYLTSQFIKNYDD